MNHVGNSPVVSVLSTMPSTPYASALKYGMLRAMRATRNRPLQSTMPRMSSALR